MKVFFIIYFFSVIGILTIFGLHGRKSERTPLELFPDMDRQSKFHEQSESALFEDNRTDRPVVKGTIPFLPDMQKEYVHLRPKDHFYEDNYLATGRIGNQWGDGFPIALTHEAMAEGKALYSIYCVVCHSPVGDGNGITKSYGMIATASLLGELVRNQPDGEIFNTITNGKNSMLPYGAKIRPEDRWKIIAYVRALQYAADAPAEVVPASVKGDLGL